MTQNKIFNLFIGKVTLIGFLFFIMSLIKIDFWELSTGAFLISLASISFLPFTAFLLPHSRFAVSFSDTVIFFIFLVYGAPLAIAVAALEAAFSIARIYFKSSHISTNAIPFNFGATAISTSAAFLSWDFVVRRGLVTDGAHTLAHLIVKLFFVCFIALIANSLLITTYIYLLHGVSPLKAWKEQLYSTLLTTLGGAVLAGVFYRIYENSAVWTSISLVVVLAAGYFGFRMLIQDIKKSVGKAELAERERADIERLRAEDAIGHANALKATLDELESASLELRQSREVFRTTAVRDQLIGIPNRFGLIERLDRILSGNSSEQQTYSIVIFDLIKFKFLNDMVGHNIGDEVLKIVARRISSELSNNEMIARLGSDEFVALLIGRSSEEVLEFSERIREKLKKSLVIRGRRVNVALRAGVVQPSSEYHTAQDILRDADIIRHELKVNNQQSAVFDRDLRMRLLEKLSLENDLRHALERRQLEIHFQPIVALNVGEISGFEVLLRWKHPEKGMISPMVFIPIAEETGLIVPITIWLLEESCRQIVRWQKEFTPERLLSVSVNFSRCHLNHENLIEDLERIVKQTRIYKGGLHLEVTESTAMTNLRGDLETLEQIKDLGISLSIDDFGTGYSSLSHLSRLPYDTLKIDRAFVSEVGDNGENSTLLRAINALAMAMEYKVVAEGVETVHQLMLLQKINCSHAQGYFLAKPMPAEAVEKVIFHTNSWENNIKDTLGIAPGEQAQILPPKDENARYAENNLPIF